MMLRNTALAVFLTLSTTAPLGASDPIPDGKTACYDYSDLNIDVAPKECNWRHIVKHILLPAYIEKNAEAGTRCRGGVWNDIMAMTGTTEREDARDAIDAFCASALEEASDDLGTQGWDVGNVDLEEYFQGEGALNMQTGNFQQSVDSRTFTRGGFESFNYIGTDTRLNDHYPTRPESYEGGEAVRKLYEDGATNKYFDAPTQQLDAGCAPNTVLCCWGRDRQYGDGDGNCRFQDCVNQNPGDNSDLCWTEIEDDVFPYPGGNIEQDIHCHGVSWSDDINDINTKSKWNSLFYVSMYDHMYKRGYVESLTNDPKIAGSQPMCGCIEDMAPVARADCNEVVGRASYTVTVDDNSALTINPVPDTFQLEFQSCEGFDFDPDVTPEEFAEDPAGVAKSLTSSNSNNDLAAYVFRQFLEGKINDGHVDAIAETLVGYRTPGLKNNDNARADACATAFEERFPDREYEETVLVEEVEADL